MRLLRFGDWPMRAKVAALLVAASMLPLGIAAFTDVREARGRLLANLAALLAARGDQLRGQIDAFNRGYQRSALELARLPDVATFCRSGPEAARIKPALQAVLDVQRNTDPDIRGVGILDASGQVRVATEDSLVGVNLSRHPYVGEVLRGTAVISDIYVAGPEADHTPTIAYLAPVLGSEGGVLGVAAYWVRAASLWSVMKEANGLAGPRSFAVLFDHHGIRVAHTYNEDIVFHPGGPIEEALIETLVTEGRFGERTRELLADVRAFPEQFDRARAESPDEGLFRGFAPVNREWNYGVGRRFETVPWTVFYMIPEESLDAEVAVMTRRKAIFAVAIILGALMVGSLFAAVILLRPIRALGMATASLASDLTVRVPEGRTDEIGRLGVSFNSMADRLQAQAVALERTLDDLERRVQERTSELARTNATLVAEIAERRRAEGALRESEQSLATTLDSIGDAVIATDVDGRVVRMNPVAEQLTGWPLAEAKGRALVEVFDIFNEESGRPTESPVARVLREGLTVGLANHTALVCRDGTRRPIADSGAPIRDAGGAIHGVVLVFRDQTEERRMELTRARSLQLEAQNVQVQEASRLKSEFLANMSHELRTPLNAILGFSELIHDGKVGAVSAEQKEFLADILTSGQHLLQLINDVLDLSKVEAGKLEFHPEPVVLSVLIGEVMGVLRTMIESKTIGVETDVDPALTDVVLDAGRFKQVLYNYVSNALKFTPAGGRVVVRALSEALTSAFRLEVEDSGIGIAVEDTSRLFVEFQQLDAGAGKRHPGTGLGLALTKRLVEAQGGTAGVRSILGRGSTFYAILPRQQLLGTSRRRGATDTTP